MPLKLPPGRRRAKPSYARDATGVATAAATLAAAVAARAYALNNQPEQARAALKAADALMGRIPEDERSDSWLTYGEQKHHVHQSHAADHAEAAVSPSAGTEQPSQGGDRSASLRRAFSRAA
ncbi:hypothetical protein ACWGH3_38755 [Streptomyces sp. NPDC054884]|uniref:hypothetical protein n=1 Tax=Streptomyces sp. ME08-AFT2 TaxID=3028683 RepID=UPI0029B176C3|nr:hypothetical protein [Streptomyces sp. ME08-AFT2]MDX3310594.1 hypothetical protein [Streptomyces sp. ME08-AFT2]